jgi:hypothetical protein
MEADELAYWMHVCNVNKVDYKTRLYGIMTVPRTSA